MYGCVIYEVFPSFSLLSLRFWLYHPQSPVRLLFPKNHDSHQTFLSLCIFRVYGPLVVKSRKTINFESSVLYASSGLVWRPYYAPQIIDHQSSIVLCTSTRVRYPVFIGADDAGQGIRSGPAKPQEAGDRLVPRPPSLPNLPLSLPN